jgi:hypothetical protein
MTSILTVVSQKCPLQALPSTEVICLEEEHYTNPLRHYYPDIPRGALPVVYHVRAIV